MIKPKSQGALFIAVLMVAPLLSGIVSAGGLKSVLKEVNRFEKKLKDENLLDEDEDLYFSFNKGLLGQERVLV